MKSVLIIGGLGYIGSHLFAKIKETYPDCKIVILDLAKDEFNQYKHLEIQGTYASLQITTKFDGFTSLETNFDVVYLLAANSNVVDGNERPFSLLDNNVGLVQTVLNLIKNKTIITKKLVFTSSAAVYENYLAYKNENSKLSNPDEASVYGLSKIIGEKLIEAFSRQYGFEYVILRLANVAGESWPNFENHQPETHLIPLLLDVDKKMVMWNNGHNERDYIHILDVVDALIRASDINLETGIYNIGTGTGHDTMGIAKRIRGPELKNLEIKQESREGDSLKTVLGSLKFQLATEWRPYRDLGDIINSYWSHKK